ncbi:MAG: Stp1/IreP family PP2C-type Ser/Thr phosphatase [Actinobacteria bacterium]|nr:Stp1/IreP family PP2C-type Ser/Thr phosphatase [Actinomycetota bacterium]
MLRVTDHAAASDVGRMRRANEDSYFVRSPLFVVADGMGGAQAGEVASRIAVEAFAEPLNESLAPEVRMSAAVEAANREIHDQSISDQSRQGMGTTLTAALLGDEELTLAHVGDSRAYRLRDGELTRLTTDHSLVGEMVRRGAITEAEAEVHPQRSILTRALGPEPDVEVDTLTHSVRDGDVYLLCSDGLTGMVDDAQIAEVAGSGEPMRSVAEELIARANAAGGVDNITVVAFRVAGTGKPTTEAGSESSTGSETVVAPAVAPPPVSEPQPAGASRRQPETHAAGGNGHAVRPIAGATATADQQQRRRRSRKLLGIGFAVVIFLLAAIGAAAASLNVYFLGTDEHGLVTVYRGLPYEGPVALKLYTKDYVSTMPVESLSEEQRATLLDHTLRTRKDAIDLITQIESGNLKAIGQDAELGRDRITGATGEP